MVTGSQRENHNTKSNVGKTKTKHFKQVKSLQFLQPVGGCTYQHHCPLSSDVQKPGDGRPASVPLEHPNEHPRWRRLLSLGLKERSDSSVECLYHLKANPLAAECPVMTVQMSFGFHSPPYSTPDTRTNIHTSQTTDNEDWGCNKSRLTFGKVF